MEGQWSLRWRLHGGEGDTQWQIWDGGGGATASLDDGSGRDLRRDFLAGLAKFERVKIAIYNLVRSIAGDYKFVMAAEISSVKKKKPPGFMTLLSSAACEWFLIFLLFLDALFSYLLTKFAHYCDLETPCPLCSRIDHFFGEKKPGCCWSLLCSNHKEEISSLVSCSIHSKLVDVNGMCEECLMPIAMQNKSNSESYKLLVGKLWVDVERSAIQNLMLNKSIRAGSSARKTCSCCNKTWRTKSNAERLLELTPVGLGAKANIKPPLPRVPGRSRFSRRNSFMRLRDIFTGQISSETLSDVGYSKLKISSDSESEVPISEDDDDAGSSCSNYSKPEYNVVSSEKQTYQGSEVEPLILDQPDLLDLSEGKNVNSLFWDGFMENDLRELNWADSYHKPSPHLTEELISLDVHQPSDMGGGSFGATAEISNVSLPHMSALSVLSELLSLNSVPSSSNTVAITKKTINVGDKEHTSPRIHVRTAEGISLDDAHSSSESTSKNLTDDLTRSTEKRELSRKQALEPIKAEEELKSPLEVFTSEVGLLLKRDSLTQSTEKRELSCKQAFEAIKTEEEMKSLSQVSTSGVDLSKNLTDSLTHSTEKRKLSCKLEVELIKTQEEMKSLSQISASEVGLLSKDLTDNLTRSIEERDLSCKQAVEPIKTEEEMKSLSQVSTSEVGFLSENSTDDSTQSTEKSGLSIKQAVELIKTQEEMKSLSQISTSEEGGLSNNLTDNLTQNTEKSELSHKQAVEPIKTEEEMKSLSQVSTSEVGLLSKNLADNLTQSSERNELSCKQAVEPIKTEEKMKSLSQVSTSEVGLLSKDTSFRACEKQNESNKGEDNDSSSQEITISVSMKRNDSSYESLDEASLNDVEGENNIDRLKRQAEHDRNCLNSLYKELEEERNAAAISANQAMAMITRLQEEKAALHMEALQYLRMMEEQAEYDMEALQRANDLLSEREKELQDLESELEFYKNNFADESGVEDARTETSILEYSKSAENSKENCNCETENNSVSSFEDEKLYVSQCLKKLENKFHLAYCSGKLEEDMSNGLNSEIEETKKSLVLNGNLSHDKENNCHFEKSDKISENGSDTNSAIFEKEIAKLYDRLEALENDRDFIKHASNLLRNGNDGLQLIEEIAHQLQELRKIEFKNR
ncbi:hypothetical protein BUALT_Bualt13G0017600 [Buddleja alternifolia]|uniref:GTD-binding domain-containing protein n=1 Tax=Buddleja alternifolia TaxID=168488 RepID=A0AAV6WI02_9LAMI|nr:hypothetical protein BUALT_Bualt13G0017600 [Buddleja alternifolia]